VASGGCCGGAKRVLGGVAGLCQHGPFVPLRSCLLGTPKVPVGNSEPRGELVRAWRREGSGDTLKQLPVPEGACERAGEGLVTRAWGDRTRGDGSKLKEGRFRLDLRKKFFTVRVVRPRPRLPREAVAAPSLAVFKARLDGALSTLVWWKGSLPTAGGMELDDL